MYEVEEGAFCHSFHLPSIPSQARPILSLLSLFNRIPILLTIIGNCHIVMGLQKGIPFPSSLQGSRNLLRNQHLPISAPLALSEWGNLISPARRLYDLGPCLWYYTLFPRETRRHQINNTRRVDPHSFDLLIGAYSNPNS